MNQTNNRINIVIPVKDKQAMLEKIKDLESLFRPYLAGLTPSERKTLPKINVDNKVFVEDVLNHMTTAAAADFLPGYLSPAAMQYDLTLFEQMDELLAPLASLVSKVDDTRLLAGSEAYSSSLAFKRLADAAAMSGVPGAIDISRKLKERFYGQGSGPDTPPAS